jgi:hypothetical protein
VKRLLSIIAILCLSSNLYSWDGPYARASRTVKVYPSVILPVSEYAEISEPGYGVIVSWLDEDFFDLSAELGFFYIPGVDEFESEGRSLDHSKIITAALKHEWTFKPLRSISIKPALSAGAAYISLKYRLNSGNPAEGYEKKTGIDPLVSASVSFDWDISRSFFLGLNAGYGAFIEKKNKFQFISAGMSAGLRF